MSDTRLLTYIYGKLRVMNIIFLVTDCRVFLPEMDTSRSYEASMRL